ncbi:hypothetical protein [Streptomyces sp. NPDC091040]|uniref:hypothetical protein n=1 Tax=Streptomyces sp. NPDC091040 TaxID=3365972 RepID=UPI0037F82021
MTTPEDVPAVPVRVCAVAGLARELRAAFPAVELDAEDGTRVVWVPLAEAAGLHLYPAAGPVLLDAAGPDVLLPPLTDLTYAWR